MWFRHLHCTKRHIVPMSFGSAVEPKAPCGQVHSGVTAWGDTPNLFPKFDVALGKGPAIKIRDSGMISDPRIVDWMVRTAKKAKIPYQREVLLAGSTDARDAVDVRRYSGGLRLDPMSLRPYSLGDGRLQRCAECRQTDYGFVEQPG